MFDEEQRTPLMVACENNRLDTVKYLLRAGAAIGHKVSQHTVSLFSYQPDVRSCQIHLLHPSLRPISLYQLLPLLSPFVVLILKLQITIIIFTT